jgi:hypothetical protein
MKLPFEDNSFDHVYTIEAVCHAPDKVNRYYKNDVFSIWLISLGKMFC